MHSSNMRELATITEVVGVARLFCLPLIVIDSYQAERAPGSPETEALRMGTIKLPKNRHQQIFIIFVVLSCSPFEVLQCFRPVLSPFNILTR